MSNKKLDTAKQNLSKAFETLELVMINKINQFKKNNVTSPDSAINSNQDLINNLYNEINSLQKTLVVLKLENERLESFKLKSQEVLNHVKLDLAQIKKISNPINN